MTSNTILKLLLVTFLLAAASVSLSDARGGRGRGGGSFGGLFGGWRKYKKPVSSGSGRRTISGSPYQPLSSGSSSHSTRHSSSSGSVFASKQSKTQASFTKQHQMPATNTGKATGTATGAATGAAGGYGHGYYGGGHGYYGGGAPGAAGAAASHPLPPGGSYYANTAAMPAGAVYVAQPPIYTSSSSGTGNFLWGMMAGHMLSNGLFGHRPYVTHVYQQAPPTGENGSGSKVIIINNGNGTEQTLPASAPTPNYWPMATDVPLAPFNASVTPEESLTSAATPPPPSQVGGIICVPMLFNVSDPNDANKTQQVEKMVCYPAPPPPPPSTPQVPGVADNCFTRIVTEIDPNDPTKTIEVAKLDCTTLPTTQPPVVAGEIGESTSTASSNDTAQPVTEQAETGH